MRRLPFDGAAGGVLPPTGLRPAIYSAAKAILAFLPEAERKQVLAKTQVRLPRTVDDRSNLEAELATVSKSAFATCFGEEDPYISSFATPLTVQGRSGQFSTGIVGPRRRIEAVWVDRQRILRDKAAALADRIANVMSEKA